MKGSFQKMKLGRKQSATSSTSTQSKGESQADKLAQLRSKIQKDRQVMRKSGRRFNSQSSSTQSVGVDVQADGKGEEKVETGVGSFAKKEKKVAEVEVGTEGKSQSPRKEVAKPEPVRERIDLSQLAISEETTSMTSSRVFDRQVKQQKKRNQEIHKFLGSLKLQSFAQGLISMGYDDMEVLVEVKSEDLNFLRMRGRQQDTLTKALDEYRKKNNIEAVESQSNTTKEAFFRTKTQMNEAPARIKPKDEEPMKKRVMTMSARPKSAATELSTNNSGLHGLAQFTSNCSFLAGIGGKDWSLSAMVRRACSGCFKVFPSNELQEETGGYYCQGCLSKQLLGVSLTDSMIRDYKP